MFRVTCTATGGTLSTSSLTGPGLGDGGLELQAEGRIGRTGQNTYSVTGDTLARHSVGDTYICTASNNVSSLNSSIVLAGITTVHPLLPHRTGMHEPSKGRLMCSCMNIYIQHTILCYYVYSSIKCFRHV